MDKFEEADNYGRRKVIATILADKRFGKCELTIKEMPKFCEVDVTMTATTSNGKEHYYAIEVKDRKYCSNAFKDWLIEDEKYEALTNWQSSGYTAIYANTFEDGVAAFFDVKDVDVDNRMKEKTYKKYTVEDNGRRVTKRKITIPMSKAKWQTRVPIDFQ